MVDGQERFNPIETSEFNEELDRELLHDLIVSHPVSDEGREGYILKVVKDELSGEQIASLEASHVEFLTETSVKVLKIYNPGKGKRDFDITQAANRVLNTAEGAAKSPRALAHGDTPVTDEIRSKLPNIHSGGGDLEVVAMEYVPGKDLATKIYLELAKQLVADDAAKLLSRYGQISDEERKNILEQQVEDADALASRGFPVLADFVSERLGFVAAGGGDKKTEAYRLQRTLGENIQKIKKYMERKSLQLDPRVFVQLRKAVEYLHQAGIYHNDLHERNIVVDGDVFLRKEGSKEEEEFSGPNVYLIDFGLSSTPDHPVSEVTMGDEVLFSDDLATVLRWGGADAGKKQALTEAERSALRGEKIETARNFRDQLRIIQQAEGWNSARAGIWQKLKHEREQLVNFAAVLPSQKDKTIDNIVSKIRIEAEKVKTDVSVSDRMADLVSALCVTYPSAVELFKRPLGIAPVTVSGVKRYIEYHGEL